MPVAVIGCRADKRRLPTCVPESFKKTIRDLRTEKMIVLGIDPQHGDPRFLSKLVEGAYEFTGVADFVRPRRPAAASKADRRNKSWRRFRCQRNGGESAGRNSNADDSRGVDFRKFRKISNGFAQVLRGFLARIVVVCAS